MARKSLWSAKSLSHAKVVSFGDREIRILEVGLQRHHRRSLDAFVYRSRALLSMYYAEARWVRNMSSPPTAGGASISTGPMTQS